MCCMGRAFLLTNTSAWLLSMPYAGPICAYDLELPRLCCHLPRRLSAALHRRRHAELSARAAGNSSPSPTPLPSALQVQAAGAHPPGPAGARLRHQVLHARRAQGAPALRHRHRRQLPPGGRQAAGPARPHRGAQAGQPGHEGGLRASRAGALQSRRVAASRCTLGCSVLCTTSYGGCAVERTPRLVDMFAGAVNALMCCVAPQRFPVPVAEPRRGAIRPLRHARRHDHQPSVCHEGARPPPRHPRLAADLGECAHTHAVLLLLLPPVFCVCSVVRPAGAAAAAPSGPFIACRLATVSVHHRVPLAGAHPRRERCLVR